MATYQDDLRNKQTELIRKALDGSVFVAPIGADPIETLSTGATAELSALPEDWDDLGWLTSDGAQFSREVSQSEIQSFGSVTPTRTDVVSDSSTLTLTMQETKLLTIGLGTGTDFSAIEADATTGEVVVKKPLKPVSKHYRVLSLVEDEGDGGAIYIARFLPRAKVTNYAEQNFSSGDEAVPWGVTFTGEEDSTLGFSEAWLFAGPGWKALLTQMGIPSATP